MPLLTRASAADLTRSSVTLQPKRFQLFQPIGGVRARPLSRACEDGAQRRNPKKSDNARRLIFFEKLFIRPSRRIFILVSRRNDKTASACQERRARLTSVRTISDEERSCYAVAVAAFAATSAA